MADKMQSRQKSAMQATTTSRGQQTPGKLESSPYRLPAGSGETLSAGARPPSPSPPANAASASSPRAQSPKVAKRRESITTGAAQQGTQQQHAVPPAVRLEAAFSAPLPLPSPTTGRSMDRQSSWAGSASSLQAANSRPSLQAGDAAPQGPTSVLQGESVPIAWAGSPALSLRDKAVKSRVNAEKERGSAADSAREAEALRQRVAELEQALAAAAVATSAANRQAAAAMSAAAGMGHVRGAAGVGEAAAGRGQGSGPIASTTALLEHNHHLGPAAMAEAHAAGIHKTASGLGASAAAAAAAAALVSGDRASPSGSGSLLQLGTAPSQTAAGFSSTGATPSTPSTKATGPAATQDTPTISRTAGSSSMGVAAGVQTSSTSSSSAAASKSPPRAVSPVISPPTPPRPPPVNAAAVLSVADSDTSPRSATSVSSNTSFQSSLSDCSSVASSSSTEGLFSSGLSGCQGSATSSSSSTNKLNGSNTGNSKPLAGILKTSHSSSAAAPQSSPPPSQSITLNGSPSVAGSAAAAAATQQQKPSPQAGPSKAMASVGVQVALPVAGGAASTGSSITGNTGATPGQPASTTSSTTAATITSPFALASKSSNNSAVRPVLATAPSVGLPPMPPPGSSKDDQEREVTRLRVALSQARAAYNFLRNEYGELETLQKETDAARREFAARYAFSLLDTDMDGYVRTDQVQLFDVFQPYAPSTLDTAFRHWRYASGYPGFLTSDDFLLFVQYADERSTRKEAQRFWFSVLDADGDGMITAEDAKIAYDAITSSRPPTDSSSFVVPFEDLWRQLLDMVKPEGGASQGPRGFTAPELYRSKLGPGVLGLLTNHGNMLLARTTAEWGRGDWPL